MANGKKSLDENEQAIKDNSKISGTKNESKQQFGSANLEPSREDEPMTDAEATPLHWIVLECLEAMLFGEEDNQFKAQ